MRRDAYQAIADPVRREILDILAQQSLTVSEVAMHFTISRQAVSKHLKILHECGLVSVHPSGKERYYRLEPKSLIPPFMWIDQLQQQWNMRIDSFEQYITELKDKNDKNKSL